MVQGGTYKMPTIAEGQDKTCPFCEQPIFSVTTRRLTPDVIACRTCGDKILPILHAVSNDICNTILANLAADEGTLLTTVLRGMLDDELNIYVAQDNDLRRRLEASL